MSQILCRIYTDSWNYGVKLFWVSGQGVWLKPSNPPHPHPTPVTGLYTVHVNMKPLSGAVCIIMKSTRKRYHKAIRGCQKRVKTISRDRFAKACIMVTHAVSVLSEVERINSPRKFIPCMCVYDGHCMHASGADKIAVSQLPMESKMISKILYIWWLKRWTILRYGQCPSQWCSFSRWQTKDQQRLQ